MPTMPSTFRAHGSRTRIERGREYDARRRDTKPWRALYKTARWQTVRAHQLSTKPLCERCEAEGVVAVATIVHHVEPHRGDEAKFFSGPFQSLCKRHHDSDAHSEEMRG